VASIQQQNLHILFDWRRSGSDLIKRIVRARNTTLHDIPVYHTISYLCWLKLAVLRVHLTLYFHLSVTDAEYVSHWDYAFNLESAVVIGITAISFRWRRSHPSISSGMPRLLLLYLECKDS